MNRCRRPRRAPHIGLAALIALAAAPHARAGDDVPSDVPNPISISQTRHNLTQSFSGSGAVFMDPHRNDYQEVCVYCHTPHGANPNVNAPLWNRTISSATYRTYDELGTSTLTQSVTAPGPSSITCLSCHDGTLGVDSIINMPNRNSLGQTNANYSATQYNAPQDNSFLDTWQNVSGNNASHVVLGAPDTQTGGSSTTGCMVCHSRGSGFSNATDFTAFVIGDDLTNDHPIGVTFPTAAGVDFNPTTGATPGLAFFDANGDGRANNNEIRLYDSGDGMEVECASCHDPHGVPSGPRGSVLIRSFLRVDNAGSGVCMTCHVK